MVCVNVYVIRKRLSQRERNLIQFPGMEDVRVYFDGVCAPLGELVGSLQKEMEEKKERNQSHILLLIMIEEFDAQSQLKIFTCDVCMMCDMHVLGAAPQIDDYKSA